MCAKCKLQLGQHFIDNQAQNDAATANSMHLQYHNFQSNENLSVKDASKFDNLNSKELIKLQNALRQSNNLISRLTHASSDKINQKDTSENLIDAMDNEIFLINEELRVPLLHIANKLLGRQNLNFDQLTPPEQQ